MGLFGHGKKEQNVPKPEQRMADAPSSREMTCIFCGKKIDPKDLIFAIESNQKYMEEDRIYHDFIQSHYETHAAKNRPPFRLKYLEGWKRNEVIAWEDERQDIPLVVRGIFRAKSFRKESTEGGLTLSEGTGLEEETEDSEAQIITPEPSDDGAQEAASMYRLCPHCHCKLPKGMTPDIKKINIGLYGGKRSGKTTYMAMVTEKLLNDMNTMMLGNAQVIDESRDALEYLYENASSLRGADATQSDLPPFPIILYITPENPKYKPFFLSFQDIPGEFADERHAEKLINHPFSRTNAFIGIVDINMFATTEEMRQLRLAREELEELRSEEASPEAEAEYAKPEELTSEEASPETDAEIAELEEQIAALEYRVNESGWKTVFGNLAFATILQNLKSVQLVFTKIDRWLAVQDDEMDEEGISLRDMLDQSQEITRDHTEQHHGGIDTKHLRLLHRQMEALLVDGHTDLGSYEERSQKVGFGRHTHLQKKPVKNSLLYWVAEQNLNFKNREAMAYCALASRSQSTDGDENAYRNSMNLLDPILNICRWEHLLPEKDESTQSHS